MEGSSTNGVQMARGTLVIFLAELLIVPTGLITAIYLARVLGPAPYGRFALLTMIVLWIEWSGSSMFSGAVVKFIGESTDWRPISVLSVRLYFGIGCVLALMLWMGAPLLARLLHEPVLETEFRLYAIDIPIFCLASSMGCILVGRRKFREKAIASAGRRASRLILIIGFVELGLSVRGAILGMIGASVIEMAIGWVFSGVPLRGGAGVRLLNLVKFAAPLFLTSMSIRIFRMELALVRALGAVAAEVGFYGAAMNLSLPPALFSTSISSPLLSTLSHLLSAGKRSEAAEIVETVVRSVFWLLPGIVLISVSSNELVRFILGDRFGPTGPILSILIFAVLGLHAIHVSNAALAASGNPFINFLLTAPLVPVAICAHLLLIPRFGGSGAAWATASIACSAAMVSLFVLKRVWVYSMPISTIGRSLLCSFLAAFLGLFWQATGAAVLFKMPSISGIVLAVFFLLGEFSREELDVARAIFTIRSRPGSGSQDGNKKALFR